MWIGRFDHRWADCTLCGKTTCDQVFTDLANAGIMVCEPQILRFVPAETVFDFGHHVYPAALNANIPIFGLPINQPTEFLIDIGTPTSYARAQELL